MELTWLKMTLMLLATPGIIAPAATATNQDAATGRATRDKACQEITMSMILFRCGVRTRAGCVGTHADARP